MARMTSAERATLRRLIDGRSKKTAINMIAIMMKARSAETAKPEIRK